MQKLVIIGGSLAYWEISELINDINEQKPSYEVIGILDDNAALQGLKYHQHVVDGPIDKAKEYPADVKFIFCERRRIEDYEVVFASLFGFIFQEVKGVFSGEVYLNAIEPGVLPRVFDSLCRCIHRFH